MKEMRRVLALLMCFVMLVGYIPAGALAAETEPTVAVVEQTQPAEEVVEAAFGEAVSASDEKADSTPAETEAPTEETEVVEEIIEAVFGEEISASKPAATPEETEAPEETVPAETEAEETVPAETEPAETLEEVEASEEAEEAQAEDEEDLLYAALDEAQAYIAAIMNANDPSEVVGTFGKHFTWDNEERELAKNNKDYLYDWSYYNGVVFEGLEYLYEVTGDTQYRDYVLEYLSGLITEDGSWAVTSNNSGKTAAGYVDYHGADCYKTASLLLDAYTMSGDTRYLETAAVLYADLDAAAEEYSLPNAGNNYRHTWKSDSTPDLWLDGLYMTLPFRAEYAALMGDQAELDLIVDRLQWVSDNMYNADTGLFYHAADNATSNSGTHWLRSMGWYAAAMVDVMDHMEGENLEAMKAQLKKMVDGMAAVQNADNGMWLNNMKAELDAKSNPYETSGTALVTYAVMKAVNNGWLEESYAQMAIDAFLGICEEKLVGGVLKDICLKGNPGSSNSTIVDNEGKGVGPFIMLYTEIYEYLYGAVELEPVLESIVASGRDTFDQREAFEEPVVTALFTDFSGEVVTGYEITGDYNMDVPGTYTLTVAYEGKTTQYTFTVVEKAPVLVEGLDAEVQDVSEDIAVVDAMWHKGMLNNYVAYDISAELAEGETAEVSIPVPAEWADEKLVAYHIDDEGNISDETFTVTYADGYATFTVSHFSIYVVGPAGAETTIELDGNELKLDSYPVTEIVTKEVYKLVPALDGAGDYLIASGNNGEVNVLTINTSNGITTSTATAVRGRDEDGVAVAYIENPAANTVWTATAVEPSTTSNVAYRLRNVAQGRFLQYSENWYYGYSLTTSDTSAANWQTPNPDTTSNMVRAIGGPYITSSMGASRDASTVSIYKKQTVSLMDTQNLSGVFTLTTEPVTALVDPDGGTKAYMTAERIYTPNDPSKKEVSEDVTANNTTFSIHDDPAGIISGIEADTDTITFSGKYGSAVVKVEHNLTEAENITGSDGEELVLVEYIQVTAKGPYYTVEIRDDSGASIDTLPPFFMTGEDNSRKINYVILYTYLDENGKEATKEIEPAEGSVSFESTDTEVAYIPGMEVYVANKFTVTFAQEGKARIFVYYTTPDGDVVSDVVDVRASFDTFVTPEDETDDFPEYPNQGAVRIDKTATAVGNFSETGMAKVELSMAGVPFSDGAEMDVVIMVDMSGSMNRNQGGEHADRVQPAKDATIAALEALVMNKDGSFNNNRVAIYTFSSDKSNTDLALNPNSNGFCPLTAFDQNLLTAVTGTKTTTTNNAGEEVTRYSGGVINTWTANGGTDYKTALSTCEEVLSTARGTEEGKNREQYVIFVTDGSPTAGFQTYVDGTSGDQENLYDEDHGEIGETTNKWKNIVSRTEVYSHTMKSDGVTVYSVGIGLLDANGKALKSGLDTVLKKIAGTQVPKKDADGNVILDTNGNPVMELVDATQDAYKGYARFVDDSSATGLKDVFMSIVGEIKQAATEITVTDLVAPEFSLVLEKPDNVTLPDGTELAIEVVEYTLNDKQERVSESVIESVKVTDTDKVVTDAQGRITAINAKKFTYTAYYAENPDDPEDVDRQELIWKEPILADKELAIRYYVYLDNSAGVSADKQVEAGIYQTNVNANMNYRNFKGTECQQTFPIPQMAWNGAIVTYQFYLVNEKGQPVNRAGRVVPFAEAIYVTEPDGKKVTWNKETGVSALDADYLAETLLPGVYTLYDPAAYYELRVYQTEGVDENGVNLNYFSIDGSDETALQAHLEEVYKDHQGMEPEANTNTTKVFNTKAGTNYSDYGVYSKHPVGTVVRKLEDNTKITVTKQTSDKFDFNATVVNFAVVWTPGLTPDTVVVDYGLDVELNVRTNDINDSVVVGVMNEQPKAGDDVVAIGVGTYANSKGSQSLPVTITTDDGKTVEVGTASAISQDAVKFSMNKANGTLLSKPAVFYYEAEVSYVGDKGLTTDYMYSSVTVIPATTVYYEDNYVKLASYNAGYVKATAADFYDASYNKVESKTPVVTNKYYILHGDGQYELASYYVKDDIEFTYTPVTYYVKNGSSYQKAYFIRDGVDYFTKDGREYVEADVNIGSIYVRIFSKTSGSGWTKVTDESGNGTQATDRPGVYNKMENEKDFDANNVYGYDGAYANCSTYSMNNAVMTNINAGKYATAEFDFYGTGFDVISMTSNRTGTLVVQAFPYAADGVTLSKTPTESIAVDTYYGYDYGLYDVTYVYAVKWVDGVKTYQWRMMENGVTPCDTTKTEVSAWNPDSYDQNTQVLVAENLPTNVTEANNGEIIVKREMYWMQKNDTDNVLYQIPVMKIDGLTYGKYKAVITATYFKDLDHTADDGYDLYLDAIRIYDPAGDTYGENGNIEQEIQDAYIKDGEAWPKYFELRNLLIKANDFDALADGEQTEGAIFIDQKAGTYTIADYESYGPNNELYLAPGQAVSFTLDLTGYGAEVADVQIGLKNANAGMDAKVTITSSVNATSTAQIPSGTDRYYRIREYVDLAMGATITLENTGSSGSVVSITNLKITFKAQPAEVGAKSGPVVADKNETNAVLMKMNAGKQEAQPEVKLDADLDVSIRKTSVKVGSSVVVKITTSADVDSLTVNGEKITKFSQNRQTGKRSWTATVKAEEAGDLEIEVVAYNGATELDTDTQTVEVTKAKATIAQNVIDTIISKLFR